MNVFVGVNTRNTNVRVGVRTPNLGMGRPGGILPGGCMRPPIFGPRPVFCPPLCRPMQRPLIFCPPIFRCPMPPMMPMPQICCPPYPPVNTGCCYPTTPCYDNCLSTCDCYEYEYVCCDCPCEYQEDDCGCDDEPPPCPPSIPTKDFTVNIDCSNDKNDGTRDKKTTITSSITSQTGLVAGETLDLATPTNGCTLTKVGGQYIFDATSMTGTNITSTCDYKVRNSSGDVIRQGKITVNFDSDAGCPAPGKKTRVSTGGDAAYRLVTNVPSHNINSLFGSGWNSTKNALVHRPGQTSKLVQLGNPVGGVSPLLTIDGTETALGSGAYWSKLSGTIDGDTFEWANNSAPKINGTALNNGLNSTTNFDLTYDASTKYLKIVDKTDGSIVEIKLGQVKAVSGTVVNGFNMILTDTDHTDTDAGLLNHIGKASVKDSAHKVFRDDATYDLTKGDVSGSKDLKGYVDRAYGTGAY